MKRMNALVAAVVAIAVIAITVVVVVMIIIPLVTFIIAAFVLLALVAGVLAWLRRAKGAKHRPQGETITVEYKESEK